MSLISLPFELREHIAACVETGHWPTLAAFSLTSNACHEASLSVIFRRICITVHDREGLRRDIDALIADLSRTNSFRQIQQITVKGALKLKDKRIEGYGPQTPWSVTSGLVDILNEEPIFYSGMYAVYDEAVIEKSSEEDMAWAPMVSLLQAGIPLKDLVYDCQSQFPPSLLKILHEQHSQCRLHHLTFKFRTLFWGVPFPYEMELATSPSLYRVRVLCARRDSDGDDDFNLEAMMELTAGLAPNIKEVVVVNVLPGRSLSSTLPRGSWQGLPGFTRGKRGSLKSLSLKGYSRLRTPTMLQDWARHIDLAGLQHLTLGGSSDNTNTFVLSGETMNWVAQTQSFPLVKTLCVYLTRDDVYVERPHYSEHAVSFFRAFEPLEQLSIDGPVDSRIVDSVLAHHGPTLRKLSLHPVEGKSNISNARSLRDIPFEFTKDRVLQIEAQCPVLEELAIPVKRNKSGASEAEIYRCFSKMKRLRSLFLILDCSNWRVARDPTYDPNFEEEDRKPLKDQIYYLMRRGDLKETFINCAVDEALARSIWKIISQDKTGRQLERLKLWTTGEGEYGGIGLPYTFSAMARNLARSWLFERVPRDDQEEFTVKELRQERRKACDQNDAAYCARGHNQEMWEVFRSIWPSKGRSEDWRDDWSSFPL